MISDWFFSYYTNIDVYLIIRLCILTILAVLVYTIIKYKRRRYETYKIVAHVGINVTVSVSVLILLFTTLPAILGVLFWTVLL